MNFLSSHICMQMRMVLIFESNFADLSLMSPTYPCSSIHYAGLVSMEFHTGTFSIILTILLKNLIKFVQLFYFSLKCLLGILIKHHFVTDVQAKDTASIFMSGNKNWSKRYINYTRDTIMTSINTHLIFQKFNPVLGMPIEIYCTLGQ